MAIAVASLAFACNALIGIRDVPPAADAEADAAAAAEGGGDGGDEMTPLAEAGNARDSGNATDSGDAMTTTSHDSGSDAPGDGAAGDGGHPCIVGQTQGDPYNCGTCGHSCLGGSCDQSRCLPFALVASGVGVPAKLAQDGTSLYWTDTTNGAVNRSDKKTGATQPVTQMTTNPFPIVFDDAGGGVVFWGDAFGVHRCPASGCVGTGAPPTVGTSSLGVNGLAVDSTSVYWSIGLPEVRTAAKYGSAKPGTAVWDGDASVEQIATDGRQIFFTASDGQLHAVGVDGGGETAGAWGNPTSAPAMGIALFGGAVYWTVYDTTNGGVYSAPTPLTPPPVAVGSVTSNMAQPGPAFVATDGTMIYWVDYPSASNGSILGCPIASCDSPTVLAQGNSYSPASILVDDVAIYWSDNGPNATIWKLAK